MATASDVWGQVTYPVEPGCSRHDQNSVVVQADLGLLPIKASGTAHGTSACDALWHGMSQQLCRQMRTTCCCDNTSALLGCDLDVSTPGLCAALHCTAGAIGNNRLLAMLLASGAPTKLYGTPVVSALITNKWNEFGRAHMYKTIAWFLLQTGLFYAFQVSSGAARAGLWRSMVK